MATSSPIPVSATSKLNYKAVSFKQNTQLHQNNIHSTKLPFKEEQSLLYTAKLNSPTAPLADFSCAFYLRTAERAH